MAARVKLKEHTNTRGYAYGSAHRVDSCTHGGDTARCKCKWLARYRGKKKTFDTKPAAENWLDELRSSDRKAEGRTQKPEGPHPLFGAYAMRFIEKKSRLSFRTKITYLSTLKHGFDNLGNVRMDRISQPKIVALMEKLYAEGVYEGTVLQLIQYLMKPMFALAIKEGWITKQPCVDLDFRDVPDPERYVPDSAEIHAIAKEIGPFWRAGIYLMWGAGLRQGEVLGLTEDCIRGDKIFIYRQWRPNSTYGPLKHDTKKAGRWIPIDPVLASELKRHIEIYGIKKKAPLFPSNKFPERPFSGCTLDKELREATQRLGLHALHITSHNFRHAFATHGIARGIAIPEMSKMLGHKNIQTTYETYYKMPKDMDDIRASVNSFMSADVPEEVELAGVFTLIPADNREEVAQLKERLRLLTGQEVILQAPALAA